MKKEELSELTDEQLLAKAKKMKSASIISALLIGVMAGVVIWSVVKSTVGFFTLIPLYFAYRLINSSKDDKALNEQLKEQLKERNLK